VVIEHRITRIFEQVAQFPACATLEKVAAMFSVNLLRITLSPQQISLTRLISMHSGSIRARRRFYENGSRPAEELLATYVAEMKIGQVTRLRSLDGGSPPDETAHREFRSLVRPGFDAEPLSERRLRKQANGAVPQGLRGYLFRPMSFCFKI
jgi:hypothetical protein